MWRWTEEILRPLVGLLDEPSSHDPDELRARAEELLSRPPYSDAQPGPFDRALEWLRDAVARFLDDLLSGLAGTGAVGAWIIAVIGLVVLVAVVWRLTRGATLDRSVPEVPSVPGSRSAASWADEARRHERDGRLHDAVRSWYAALAVGLVEVGTLDELPGRTVRELNLEVQEAASHLSPFVEVAGDRFETIVYGGGEATPGDVAEVRDAATHVLGVHR